MAEDRNKTVNRLDDRRLATGTRLLFNRKTHLEALHLSRLALQLSPERCRQLRLLAEEMQHDDSIEALSGDLKGGA